MNYEVTTYPYYETYYDSRNLPIKHWREGMKVYEYVIILFDDGEYKIHSTGTELGTSREDVKWELLKRNTEEFDRYSRGDITILIKPF